MIRLVNMLQDSPPEVLYAIAQIWGVPAAAPNDKDLVKRLAEAMQQPDRAERIWDILSPQERSAIQMLVASKNQQMTLLQFEIPNGKIRKMGSSQIDRDQPHRRPQSIAEGLYYRGLIGEAFGESPTGLRPIVYIPPELVAVLPLHRTAYSNLDDEDALLPAAAAPPPLSPLDQSEVEAIQPADTSIVDDMTTLLAYLRLYSVPLHGVSFAAEAAAHILPYLLVPDERRLDFLFWVGISAELIQVSEGRAYAGKQQLQPWLSAPRGTQIRLLAEAWRDSPDYLELWHVPGLYPDPGGVTCIPTDGRAALRRLLAAYVPPQAWWSLDDFIEIVKAVEPAFQRPGGDYESWYIRDAAGDYLRGFASWDAVEGALLQFYCQGPLHWLGLADLAEDAVRLTAYGRAFLELAPWQNPNIKPDTISVQPDGLLLASRRVPCVDRFQLARFTLWTTQRDPYAYQLTPDSLEQAADQGISPAHIAAFLKRHLDQKPLPPRVQALLETWQRGSAAAATLETLLVLRTTTREALDQIYENPALRRCLRARLGETAGVVDATLWEELAQALAALGLRVERLS